MNLKTWISAALCVLLAVAGGVIGLTALQQGRVREAESIGDDQVNRRSANGAENADAPRVIPNTPERLRHTRWNALDETGTNHRCNGDDRSQIQNETPCASSPVDPEIIIVGANDYRDTMGHAGFYRTTDGGNTWTDALQSQEYGCDPVITADAAGRFHAVYLAPGHEGYEMIYAQLSTDNGLTWTDPVTVSSVDENDKPHAVCDVNPVSPFANNLYVAWLLLSGSNNWIEFSRSTDRGVSFSQPVTISPPGLGAMPCLSVGPNGEVYCVWYRQGHIEIIRSLDAGLTWGDALNVCEFLGATQSDNPCGMFRTVHGPVVACDISSGAHRGSVYVCCDMDRPDHEDNNIYFSRSDDGGRHWSDTLRINDDATTNWQWWPWMTVHPRTGDIAISWLDRRNDPDNCNYEVYGTISTDGGATWAPNLRISDVTSVPGTTSFLGDYTGLTSTSLGFLSSWPDTRNDEGDAYAAWWNNGDSLALTSPNGGETWAIAQPCSVRWHFRYAPDSLKIEVNRHYPSGNWDSLTTVRSSDGLWIWFPNGDSSSTARLRLVGQHFPAIGDTSDANFSVELPAPRITAYRVGNDIRIMWSSTGAPFYLIYSDTEFGGSYTTLEGITSGTTFLDIGAAAESGKFYVVRASTEP